MPKDFKKFNKYGAAQGFKDIKVSAQNKSYWSTILKQNIGQDANFTMRNKLEKHLAAKNQLRQQDGYR